MSVQIQFQIRQLPEVFVSIDSGPHSSEALTDSCMLRKLAIGYFSTVHHLVSEFAVSEREEKEERVDTTAVVATKCVKSFVKLCTTIRFLSLSLASPLPLVSTSEQQ